MKKIFYILFLTILMHEFSFAQVYVNYSTGNDATGDGTSANPYKTFYKGYTIVASGGILDLTGTFTWTNSDETGDSQNTGYTISKNITIRGQGPGNTIVQAHSLANSADRRVFTITNGYTVTFKDLSIKHGKGWAGYISTTYYTYHGGAIGSAYGSSTSTVIFLENVNISTNYSSYSVAGIYSEGKIVINKCTFENNSATSGHTALELEFCGTVQQRDVINTTFYNNTSTGNDYATVYVDRFGANLINCTFINNTNGVKAYALYSDSRELYITNCIIANSTNWDLYATSGSANGVKVRNSIVEIRKSGTTQINYTSCDTVDQPNLNVVTPTTNGSNNNITPYIELSSTSIAVNAGTSGSFGSTSYSGAIVSAPVLDQRYGTRNSTIDIGAYEYGGTLLSLFPSTYSTSKYELNYGNTTSASTSSNGLWFSVGTTLATSNFLIYGNNNTSGISVSDLTTASCETRTARIWYVVVTGAVTSNVILDNSVATGISITAATATNYKLLYRATTSGDFSVVASGSSIASTDQITFSNVSLSDGYYAIGTINGVASPLPVELKSFTVRTQNNNAILNWKTATETNNSGFEVERISSSKISSLSLSKGNQNWDKIGFVRGSGTSSVEKNYTFTDNKLRTGKYSYRLKQIDLDGTTEYSKTVAVEVGGIKSRLRTNPNPFNNTTIINYEIEEKTEVTIKLYDILGRVVAEILNNEPKEIGEHEIKLNASNLASGVYLLKFQTNKINEVEKLILLK